MKKQTLEPELANGLVQGIERLIVLHVVLPTRSVYFASPDPESTTTDKRVSLKQVNIIANDLTSRMKDGDMGLTSDLLPALLDVAIRALPRDTFKGQVNEAPWLEVLFAVLSARAGYNLDPETLPDATADIGVLQSLFEVAIDRKFSLSLGTLMQYAIKFSGLHRSFEAEVQWILISEIFQLGIDVFLPNSGLEDSKNLLDSLVKHLTNIFIEGNGSSSDTFRLLKDCIVIPLFNGFFGARDGDTILQVWIDQLRILDEARANNSTISPSVWEDDDVSHAYGGLLAKTASSSLIGSRIDEILSTLTNHEETSVVYANVVILDAILLSGQGSIEKLLQAKDHRKAIDVLAALHSSFANSYWRWRIWRILESLTQSTGAAGQSLIPILAQSVLLKAKTVVKRIQSAKKSASSSECQEAYWCFRLITRLLEEADRSTSGEHLDEVASAVASLLEDVPNSKNAAWDGRVETASSPHIVAVACLAVLLARSSVLGLLSTETRRQLLDKFLLAVMKSVKKQEGRVPTGLNSQMIEVWFGFVSSEFLMASTNIVYDMTFILYEELKKCKVDCRLLVQSLLNIPAKLIPRHLRGNILDLLEETVIRQKLTLQSKLGIVTLMARLLDAPKAPAKIMNDVTALWELSRSVSVLDSEDGLNIFRAFRQLHKAIVDKAFTSSEENIGEYGQKTYREVLHREQDLELPNFDTLEYYLLTLSLAFLHTHQNELDKEARKVIQRCRKLVSKSVLSEFKSLTRKLKKGTSEFEVKPLIGILGVADTVVDLLQGKEIIVKMIHKIEKYVNSSEIDEAVKQTVRQRIMAYKPASSDVSKALLEYSSSFPIHQLQARDQELFVYKIHSQLSSLTKDALMGFIRDTCAAGLSGEQAAYRLLLIGMAIGLLNPIEDRESPASLELTTAFTDVSETLLSCSSIEPFCLAVEALDVFLRTQPRSVSQWNVDNLIAKLAAIVSPVGPKVPFMYAGAVYTRLCRLLGTLFGLYRKKLSGRFHLVLPIMQQLLRCLFTSTPNASAKSSSLISTQPPWIKGKASTPLQIEHAGQYTRLLTSICDPTVSSVELQRAGPNQGLSDNTKKIKSLSGQYLQYVVMEYANSQLRGHLAPEMKTALLPGLYAVLDVMSKDTMRAMNAAMDSSARAVFKRLYEDYVKFGKWNHD